MVYDDGTWVVLSGSSGSWVAIEQILLYLVWLSRASLCVSLATWNFETRSYICRMHLEIECETRCCYGQMRVRPHRCVRPARLTRASSVGEWLGRASRTSPCVGWASPS